MNQLLAILPLVAGGVLCLGGLLLPGYLLSRVLRIRPTFPGCVVGSLACLFHAFLFLQLAGLAIQAASLGVIIGCSCLVIWLLCRRLEPERERSTRGSEQAGRWHWGYWVPVAVAVFAVGYRCVLEPLSGWDHLFRWDYLARQIVECGHFSFYPSRRAADFLEYGWVDGMPPLASFLNAWLYLCFGTSAAVLTLPRILLEVVALLFAVRELARDMGGDQAGRASLALASTCGLLFWSLVIGQETGLTALSLVSMLVLLRREGTGAVVMAGVCAGVGALSREYGLSWSLLGLLVLAGEQRPWRQGVMFLSVSVLVAAPWYLRTWYLTGNPLWPQTIGGLFCGNATYEEISGLIRTYNYFGADADVLRRALISFGLSAGVLTLAGLAGLFSAWKQLRSVALAIAAVTALWMLSVRDTAGGLEYSKRVLSPALALLAVSGGVWLSRRPARWRGILIPILCILSLDAGFRVLYLPVRPTPSPIEYGTDHWLSFKRYTEEVYGNPALQRFCAGAGGAGILCDGPIYFSVLHEKGGRVVSLFSPDLRFLFEEDGVPAPSKIERLRSMGIRYVFLTQDNQIMDTLFRRHAFFRHLQNRGGQVVQYYDQRVYDLWKQAPAR